MHLDVYQGKNAENINIPEPTQTWALRVDERLVNSGISTGSQHDLDDLAVSSAGLRKTGGKKKAKKMSMVRTLGAKITS